MEAEGSGVGPYPTGARRREMSRDDHRRTIGEGFKEARPRRSCGGGTEAFFARAPEVDLVLRRTMAMDVEDDKADEPRQQYRFGPVLREARKRVAFSPPNSEGWSGYLSSR